MNILSHGNNGIFYSIESKKQRLIMAEREKDLKTSVQIESVYIIFGIISYYLPG